MVAPELSSSDADSQFKELYPSVEREGTSASYGFAIDRHLERRALRKVDLVVVPLVGMYCKKALRCFS